MSIFLGSNLKGHGMLAHRRGASVFAGLAELGMELRMGRESMHGFCVFSLGDTRRPWYDGL